MLDFPIIVNNTTLRAKDIYSFCRSHTDRGVSEAVSYIMSRTGCTQQEAEDITNDILHMDTLQKTSPPSKQGGDCKYSEPAQVYIPKCPVCGSLDVTRISSLRRYLNLKTAGLNSDTLNTQMECKNCGYKF